MELYEIINIIIINLILVVITLWLFIVLIWTSIFYKFEKIKNIQCFYRVPKIAKNNCHTVN